MNDVEYWQHMEDKFADQAFLAMIAAVAAYGGTVVCILFDLGDLSTMVFAFFAAAAQLLTLYSMRQETRCRTFKREAEAQEWRDL